MLLHGGFDEYFILMNYQTRLNYEHRSLFSLELGYVDGCNLKGQVNNFKLKTKNKDKILLLL